VVGVRAVEGGSAATLHGGGIEEQYGEAEAVSEGSLQLELPARESQSLQCNDCALVLRANAIKLARGCRFSLVFRRFPTFA
jgi:hypothetical protein